MRRSFTAVLVVFLAACSADDAAKSSSGQRQDGAGAAAGAAANDTATAGTLGSDFGNPPITDAGFVDFDALSAERDPDRECEPGTYTGTYKCTLEMNGMMSFPLEGAVSFDLAIDETMQAGECPPGAEFCQDLVIAEGSGKLFGFALLFIGFETSLEGGLDCKTGEFKAKAVNGVWGIPMSTDPNDPNAPLTVSKPPSGTFDGELAGIHLGGDPQRIEGMWSLHEIGMMLNCPGPFTVARAP